MGVLVMGDVEGGGCAKQSGSPVSCQMAANRPLNSRRIRKVDDKTKNISRDNF